MRTYYELCAHRDDAADYGDWNLVDAIDGQIARGDYAKGADFSGCHGDEGCPDCGYRGDCDDCVAAADDYDSLVRELCEYADACADSADDDFPF